MTAIGLSGAASAKRHRDAGRVETVEARPQGAPIMAIVSLSNQRVTIYDADGWILRSPVSTGQTGYETPAGIYSVLQKEEEHYSNLYDDASMPFMQRITWSGIALHAGPLPGYPASHGCVRLPHDFAERLFEMTKIGMRVIVARTAVHPVSIDYPMLFKPKLVRADTVVETLTAHWDAALANVEAATNGIAPPEADTPSPAGPEVPLVTWKSIAGAKSEEAAAAARKADAARMNAARMTLDAARHLRAAEAAKFRAAAKLRVAEGALMAANSSPAIQSAEALKSEVLAGLALAESQLATAKAEAPLKADAAARAREDAQAAEIVKAAALEASREALRMTLPVTIFISRKTQRLYVRQSFQPVLESPVTIRDADHPIGTHIYTVLGYTNGGAGLRWSAVSMPASQTGNMPGIDAKPGRGEADGAEPVALEAGQAMAALERIEIPQFIAGRVSEVISPGSSLIISDEAMSTETGEGTDFVIIMSGEPQGAIKRRRHDPDAYRRYSHQYNRSHKRSPAYAPSYDDGGPFFPW
ncbi:MAG: L,D-transpeptidase family protein [Beijerinckiaceae bacterium]|nr:L,D-transpeptidase family protein [Beijerinckiaceae bacterium]